MKARLLRIGWISEGAFQKATSDPSAKKWEDRQGKGSKPGYKERFVNGPESEPWWKKAPTNNQSKIDQQQQGMDLPTIELLHARTKLCLRHEEEMGRRWADTNFMCVCDAEGEHSILPAMRTAVQQ